MRFILFAFAFISASIPTLVLAKMSVPEIGADKQNAINISNHINNKNLTSEYTQAVIKSASSALRYGMPALALSIAEDSISDDLNQKEAKELNLLAIDAMITQGMFENALSLFSQKNFDANDAENKIRLALINVGLKDPKQASNSLKDINISTLDNEFKAWYHIANGYIAYENSDIDSAMEEFRIAKSFSRSKYLSADIEIAENICKLADKLSNDDLQETAKTLAENVKLYYGTPQGFQFAKQYAVVLFRLNKIDEAISVINNQLDIEISQEIDKDELKLISASITKDNNRKIDILKNILKTTKSIEISDYALSLLAKSSDLPLPQQKGFLQELLKSSNAKIRDRVLLELSKIAIKENDKQTAKEFASEIVKEFPSSKYKSYAIRILAWIAFSSDKNKEPEYRLAATYLINLSGFEKDEDIANELKLLAADCFQLNKDYDTASKIYEDLFNQHPNQREIVLNRTIDTALQRNDINSAMKIVDIAYNMPNIDDDAIWNAEWKIISQLRANNKQKEAFERIEHSIQATKSKSLWLRMQWLLARITEETQNTQQTIYQCNRILNNLKNDDKIDTKTKNIVASNSMLMIARCLEKEDKKDQAVEVYQNLRKDYKNTQAANASYLYQARLESKYGNYAAAQQLCRTLADEYPNSIYAYDAIFDASIYARKLGLESDYKNALTLLDELCQKFPNNPKNFYARLYQAEILRLLNAFADSRKLYEDIISKYANHPEVYLAWLGLGDCALAQPTKTINPIAIFERLYTLPDIPISAKAEAAYKYAFSLSKANRDRESREIRWLTSEQLLKQNPKDPNVRYWVGRSLFELAVSLEKDGQQRDARKVYNIIVENKLPSYISAVKKLKNP